MNAVAEQHKLNAKTIQRKRNCALMIDRIEHFPGAKQLELVREVLNDNKSKRGPTFLSDAEFRAAGWMGALARSR